MSGVATFFIWGIMVELGFIVVQLGRIVEALQ